ncbi:MAG: hypothetical protein IKX49_04585, partial [Clostridia bacterium]|nr:hypothetical protein [Clostridia bacterium]
MKRFRLFVYVIAAALLIPLFCSVVAADLVTVYVPETYVAMDGSNTEPYDTPAKAARSVNDAFDLTAAGGTMHVLPGDYA